MLRLLLWLAHKLHDRLHEDWDFERDVVGFHAPDPLAFDEDELD